MSDRPDNKNTIGTIVLFIIISLMVFFSHHEEDVSQHTESADAPVTNR